MTPSDELRLRHAAQAAARLPAYAERLEWPRERSPWHRRRLAHVDPDRLTKAVTLDTAEAHLEGLETDAYLFDEFHVLASGGSSGRRGAFVYDWDATATACRTPRSRSRSSTTSPARVSESCNASFRCRAADEEHRQCRRSRGRRESIV